MARKYATAKTTDEIDTQADPSPDAGLPQLQNVSLTVPMQATHDSVRVQMLKVRLTRAQSDTLRRLECGLRRTLASEQDGSPVVSQQSAMRWLLDQLATAPLS